MSRSSLLATALATVLLATACASTGDIASRGVMRDAGSLQSAGSLAGTPTCSNAVSTDQVP